MPAPVRASISGASAPHSVERSSMAARNVTIVEKRRLQRPAAGPHLRQVVRLVQAAVLHHVLDLDRVADVVERIGVEYDQIGQLAGLEATQILRVAEGARAVD